MALNIDFDGFGFLSSTDLAALSPPLKQSPGSPIGSESSSGISSLDSDDLKKQLSSPTISQDEEDQQSDVAGVVDEKETFPEGNEKQEDDKEESELIKEDEKVEAEQVIPQVPVKIMYQNRDILNLSSNAFGPEQLVQFTVLPENNVNCFFQNRAQYYRLSSAERSEHPIEKCSCCDFTYPSTHQQPNQGPTVIKNSLTDSILTFLKSTEQMNGGITSMPKRTMSNTPFGYPMHQAPQPYVQPQSNGFYGNNNANFNQPSMNPFMNNGNGYGTTLALLNLMNNASRNTASAFQAITNGGNNHRYYNNNMNNNFGLYKQF